jgi:hypothetical protein
MTDFYHNFLNEVPVDLPEPVSAKAAVRPLTDKIEFRVEDLAKAIHACAHGGYSFREEGPREIVMVSKAHQQTIRICRPCTGAETFVLEIKEGYPILR